MTSKMTEISKGEKFSSFEEVERRIDCYSTENFVDFYKRSSRSLSNAVKLGKITEEKAIANDQLKYYEVDYACIHGGSKHKNCSKGLRQNSTFKRVSISNIVTPFQ